jgi:hypothetical protein
VIPSIEWGEPTRRPAKNLVTVLNELAESLLGATDRKGRPNNTVIMNSHGSNLSCAKNEGQKNTAFNCGELSPSINELLNPTPMFRGVVHCVKFIFEIDALAIDGS